MSLATPNGWADDLVIMVRSLILKIRFKTVSNLGSSYDRMPNLPDWFGAIEQWPEAAIGHLMARGGLNHLRQKHFVAILKKGDRTSDAHPNTRSAPSSDGIFMEEVHTIEFASALEDAWNEFQVQHLASESGYVYSMPRADMYQRVKSSLEASFRTAGKEISHLRERDAGAGRRLGAGKDDDNMGSVGMGTSEVGGNSEGDHSDQMEEDGQVDGGGGSADGQLQSDSNEPDDLEDGNKSQPSPDFGNYWCIAALWQMRGFLPFRKSRHSLEAVGERIIKLMVDDQSLERAIPPHSEWARGWVPIHQAVLPLTLAASNQVVVDVQPAQQHNNNVPFIGDLQVDTNNRVLAVTEYSAADTAGMKVGDVIKKVAGTEAVGQLWVRLFSKSSDQDGDVELELWRSGSILSSDVLTHTSNETVGTKLIRALYCKLTAMFTEDKVKLTKGTVLREIHQPKSQFVFFDTLIRAYNSSGGKCGCDQSVCNHTGGRCDKELCNGLAPVFTHHQARRALEEYGDVVTPDYRSLESAWSFQRIYNYLPHLECNIAEKVVCLECQKKTSGLHQLTNPRFLFGEQTPHAIHEATYAQRYEQARLEVAKIWSEVGGPNAALPDDWDHGLPKSAAERDRTTVFTCRKCGKESFARSTISLHCRLNCFKAEFNCDNPGQFWSERDREEDEGVACICGMAFADAKSLKSHSRWCRLKHQGSEAEAEEEEGEEVDDVVCMLCKSLNSEEGNAILLCDGPGCNAAFHQKCVAIAVSKATV